MAKSAGSLNPAKPMANGRREKFCQFIADGLKPSEAYRKAYKCSPEVAMASVSRMLAYAEVKARIAFLQEQNAEDRAARRRRKLAVCESIWSGDGGRKAGGIDIPGVSASDRLRAIDIDNKMCGDYEPAKVDLGKAGDALAGLVISPEILEAAAKARRECFERIRRRVEGAAADGR